MHFVMLVIYSIYLRQTIKGFFCNQVLLYERFVYLCVYLCVRAIWHFYLKPKQTLLYQFWDYVILGKIANIKHCIRSNLDSTKTEGEKEIKMLNMIQLVEKLFRYLSKDSYSDLWNSSLIQISVKIIIILSSYFLHILLVSGYWWFDIEKSLFVALSSLSIFFWLINIFSIDSE